MDQSQLESLLSGLSLGGVRYFERTGSTNDQAACWADAGAPDLALVVAGEQTSGRGRAGRAWYSPAGASLSFSLVLHPRLRGSSFLPRYTGLGALAVCEALSQEYRLTAQIKWPNDVLVERRKVCGVLAEARWNGSELESVILGIGINLSPAVVSVAALQMRALAFPAACLEDILGQPVEAGKLLRAVLSCLLGWLPRLERPEFLQAWESRLAFQGEWVQLFPAESTPKGGFPPGPEKLPPPLEEGKVVGLAPDGSLCLLTHSGETTSVYFGEVRLRPTD
jgi:BirA family transcriptional regulator, biotin operon repressor / biotin---[acetyl-CoA-carboxylase] ligase